jgi:hypothetical protein
MGSRALPVARAKVPIGEDPANDEADANDAASFNIAG